MAWTKRVQALAQQTFACTADAESALTTMQQKVPRWLDVDLHVAPQAHYAGRGRPRKDASPTATTWTIQGTVRVDTVAVQAEAWRKAKFILATNVPATDKRAEEIIRLDKEQTSVERGFDFLKDPLFLASSVFVKKTERLMATGFLMVLCLRIFRLAEHRIRQRLAETRETVPDQLKKPPQRPTMRWLFQCFEGISVVFVWQEERLVDHHITGITDVHRQVLRLLGPLYEKIYKLTNEACGR